VSVVSHVSWLREGMSRSTIVSAIPIVLVIAAGGFLSYRSHVILRQDRDMVVHTYQVIGATRAAMLAAEDAETGARGFIITGDEAFLAPYEKARKQGIPSSLADLERLLIRNKGQQTRLAWLRRLIDEKFAEIRNSIDVRRKGDFEAARLAIINREDKGVMDQIRTVVSQMDFEEEKLLKERSLRAGASETRILWIAVLMAAISITVRVVIAIRAMKQGVSLPHLT